MKYLKIWLFLLVFSHQLAAQNIFIDKPVLAGKLTCFPEISNANNYYFLPNKLRLGIGADGSPQFSFLMFVKNLRGEDGEATPREGDGGGVVHAVVELYISDEERKDAERELRKLIKNDAATIVGPVIYKSGTMSLISSIADPAGGYSKVVLGLGPAPVLAGNKAAVSILLNKEGAKILWETFKTPTPDLSFSFVMDVDGYRSPIAAWIDVNFDKVYESKTIEAGLKYRTPSNNNGQGGARGRTNTPAGGGATPAGGNRPPAGGGATPAGGNRPPAGGGATPPAGGGATPPAGGGATPPAGGGATPPAGGGATPPAGGGATPPAGGGATPPAGGGATPPAGGGATPPAGGGGVRSGGGMLLTTASIMALNPFIEALIAEFTHLEVPQTNEAIIMDECGDVAAYELEDAVEGTPFYLDAEVKLMFEEMRTSGAIQVGGPQGDEKFEEIIKICYNKMLDMLFEPAGNGQAAAPDMNSLLGAANQINQQGGGRDSTAERNGGLNISVAYKFKSVKKSGKFRMDLNRSMTDALKIRFDENLGKINCKTCFRQINLEDPMFRQRGVLVSVDGMNADQFKKYVNYVAVSMKKTHGNGEITPDEVRIGVAEMEKTGNLFRLQYGWKDEKDAAKDKWMQYEYKTTWSFFGNQTIETPWTNTDNFTITASPPLRPITVEVEASPELLKKQDVRSVNVKFYYNTGGTERLEQINIRTDATTTASKVEFVLPDGKYEYEYEITWRLSGNKEVKTPRTKSTSTFLYADEMPK